MNDKTDKQNINQAAGESAIERTQEQIQEVGTDTRNARRSLLKNTLIGGGAVITAGVTGDKWAKPILNAVILPSHAQTSVTPIVMGGGSGILTASTNTGFDAGDLLGLFVTNAHAGPGMDRLTGGCLVLTIEGNVATVQLFLNNSASDTRTGTVSGTSVTVAGLHTDFTVNATLDSASNPTVANGTVSGAGESGTFSVSSATPLCAPVTPPTTTLMPTTTVMPTTTMMPTPTCGPSTTCMPNGTYMPNANVTFVFSLAKSYWS